VTTVGQNEDGKTEYYVKSMPSDMVLLSAQEYAKDGAAILLPESGMVVKMNDTERSHLIEYLKKFQVLKNLVVRNRTYHVLENDESALVSADEQAFSNSATKYFNSKINVSNKGERILSMLLCGLSFNDIYNLVTKDMANGLPRDIDQKSLNNFEHNYGKTPDVVQLATPNLAGNVKGYMGHREIYSAVGDRVEADMMYPEFNEIVYDKNTKQNKNIKVTTFGGGIAGYLSVDAYSGKLIGQVVPNVSNPLQHVKRTVEQYKLDGHKIKVYAADQGIISQSMHQIIVPETQTYLRQEGIRSEAGEPYNHNHGTPIIENEIKFVKERQRFAVLYLFLNPNFQHLGFSKMQVKQLWGEFYNWAINVKDFKQCPNVPGKTTGEVYYKVKPDLRKIRLLPICSILYVLRHVNNNLGSNRPYWQRGIYVGPSNLVVGAIRVAVLCKGNVRIVTSTVFKGVSDGGDLNPYPAANKFIDTIANEKLPDDTVNDNSKSEIPSVKSTPELELRGERTGSSARKHLKWADIESSDDEKETKLKTSKTYLQNEERKNRMARRDQIKENGRKPSSEAVEQIDSEVQANENDSKSQSETIPQNENDEKNSEVQHELDDRIKKSKKRNKKKHSTKIQAMSGIELINLLNEEENKRNEILQSVGLENKATENSNFIDVHSHTSESYYFSFSKGIYLNVENNTEEEFKYFDDQGHEIC
jgi:hypothetical protein